MTKKWSPGDVLGVIREFQPACVVAAAADLDLFEALGEEEVSAEEAASRIGGDERGTAILLDALSALGMLSKSDGKYAVPAGLRPLVRSGVPGSVLAMLQHQANCLRRWARLAETIRAGNPPPRVPSVRGEAKDRESFIEAMDVINRGAAPGLVAALSPIDFTHLLDVGGGSGTWTIAWLGPHPDARGTLFDLESVIPLAERRLGRAGLKGRVDLVPGDFYADPLPEGADLAWISAIVHQNSRDQNQALFGKVRDALVPGGRILIRDIVMDETRIRPVSGALFAVNMLSATSGGGTFTLSELTEDLTKAGFQGVKQVREDDGMFAVVEAVKPGAR